MSAGRGGYYLANARLTHTDYKRYRHSVLKIYRYLSHITKKAVLCLQVLGGRMLHTLCLPRLQVIAIATPDWRLNAICRAFLSILYDKVSPFRRGRWADPKYLQAPYWLRGLEV